ncbi:MAG: dicarboxylate/amino acid:cation symporter [Planctomycetota bacterium]|jgi:Na+/H+-dicarboxylate symporter
MKHGNLLTGLILIGLTGGAIFGQTVLFGSMGEDPNTHWTKQAGDLILIRPLLLLIIPLVFVSVVVGMTSIGDPSKLGVVGSSTVLYYLVTMLIAVTIGAILVSTFRPGDLPVEQRADLRGRAETEFARAQDISQNIEQAEREGQSRLGGAWMNILRQLVPKNIFDEMAQGRTLGVIVFALLFGLALAAGGEATRPVVRLFDGLFEAVMKLVMWVIWLTPIGVFLLVSWTVGKVGFSELVGPLSKYILLVIVGLAIHGLIVLPSVLFLFTRKNPFRYMWQMRRALMTAFGTDSSAATLPVTIESAETEGGCSKRSANFVLPLGATVNMDGTALYEAVAVVFLFQLWGIDLSFSELLIVVITATLAAIGAAGIPSAGTVTMIIVISAVNKGLEGQGVPETDLLPVAAIGVIIGVDRIVDMCRTTVNVWGDAIGAKIITKLAPDRPEDLDKALV